MLVILEHTWSLPLLGCRCYNGSLAMVGPRSNGAMGRTVREPSNVSSSYSFISKHNMVPISQKQVVVVRSLRSFKLGFYNYLVHLELLRGRRRIRDKLVQVSLYLRALLSL